MSRKTQSKYRSQGLCIFCGKKAPTRNRSYCNDCAERVYKNSLRRRKKAVKSGVCSECGGVPLVTKRHCGLCRAKHNLVTRRRSATIRDIVFNAYGGYRCKCCGETERVFLTIDHMNDDGAEHRKQIGSALYRWLIKNNFPPNFQVLCINCQVGRKYCHGTCPHQGGTSLIEKPCMTRPDCEKIIREINK